MNSALFFFQRNSTPSSSVFETFSRRLCRAFQSIDVPLGLDAQLAPSSLTAWKISAVWRTVLAGMQA